MLFIWRQSFILYNILIFMRNSTVKLVCNATRIFVLRGTLNECHSLMYQESLVQNNNTISESLSWPTVPLLPATLITDRPATDRIHQASLFSDQIQSAISECATLVTNVPGLRCHYCQWQTRSTIALISLTDHVRRVTIVTVQLLKLVTDLVQCAPLVIDWPGRISQSCHRQTPPIWSNM